MPGRYQNRKWNPQTGAWESEIEHIPDPSETMPFIRQPGGAPKPVLPTPKAELPAKKISLFIVLAGMAMGVVLMCVAIGAMAMAYAFWS